MGRRGGQLDFYSAWIVAMQCVPSFACWFISHPTMYIYIYKDNIYIYVYVYVYMYNNNIIIIFKYIYLLLL